jgi:hypothetical protein
MDKERSNKRSPTPNKYTAMAYSDVLIRGTDSIP